MTLLIALALIALLLFSLIATTSLGICAKRGDEAMREWLVKQLFK